MPRSYNTGLAHVRLKAACTLRIETCHNVSIGLPLVMAYHDSLQALADPTRRAVFEVLAAGPSPVSQIAARLPVSRPAVSQHLKVLSAAGLVTMRTQGTRRIYAVRPEGLADLRRWLDQFWGDVMARFEDEIHNLKEIQ